MMIPCLWSLLFGFDALTGVGWKGVPAGASFLADIPRGLGNGIWRKRPYGLRLLIFPQPLGGALKNQNAAPTAPPCFRRWRRSSPLPLVGEPLAKRRGFTECQGLPSIGATTTTAASGGNRESLLGPRPARRKQSAADAGCRNPGSGIAQR